MVKSPLEYFETQDFNAVPPADEAPTSEEVAFMKKYLGVDPARAAAALPVSRPDPEQLPEPQKPAEPLRPAGVGQPEPEPSAEKSLKDEEQVQFVGFTVGEQLYTIPTAVVQEVIRSMPLCRLPSMTSCMGGVINLRGRVVPVIRLRDVLEEALPAKGEADAFTIVCRCGGLQVGVQIDRVHSMYRIARQDIRWDAGASLGLGDECIAGLFQLDERLVPIVSVEHIVKTILQN